MAIEARSDQDSKAIVAIRNRLLADHCGASSDDVERAMARYGSLIAVSDRLSANGHSLRMINDGEPNESTTFGVVKQLIDPQKPLPATPIWKRIRARFTENNSLILVLVLLFAVSALAAAWQFTPIADYVTREHVQNRLAAIRDSAWAPLWVVLTYLVAGAVAFPVLVLIAATAATFGAWLGFLYATMGVLASALLVYFIGMLASGSFLKSIAGSRFDQLRREIEDRGVVAVALIRMVPLAPFSLVNLAAGACSIGLFDYIVGTLIGMLPGLLAISLLGHQLAAFAADFSATNLALLALIAAVWIGLVWSVQVLVRRFRKRTA